MVQGFDSPSEIRCPQCEDEARRKMSRFSFSFSDGLPASRVNERARRVKV